MATGGGGCERDRTAATFSISPRGLEQQQQQRQRQQQDTSTQSAAAANSKSFQTEAGLHLPAEDFSVEGQLQLSQSIGEDLRPRLQRRNQFIFSRKTALSMDQCPLVTTGWGQAPSPTPLQAAGSSMPMHSHSGSDTGLLLADSPVGRIANRIAQSMESVQKRRSVTDSTHLRVLHDSLTSLTSRLTGSGGSTGPGNSQENLQDPNVAAGAASSGTASPTATGQQQQQQQFGYHHAKSSSTGGSRNRRKIKDSRDKLADCLRLCEHTAGMPRPDNLAQLESLQLDLEPSWDRVVAPENATTPKAMKQQAAIWELLQTELNILRHLKTIIEVHMTVLRHLQSSANLLTDISVEQLFPGILPVFQAHRALWTEHLQPALAAARETRLPLRPTAFYRGFTSFREIFEPSAQYCLRIAEAKDYLKSLEKNDAFCDFVRWAQRVSQRNYTAEDGAVDLQLGSLLTMPLQRVMKYGLLLQEILRHTEDGEERLALETMIGHVTSFCNELNSTYRAKCDQADLRGVSDRLEDSKLPDWMESLGEDATGFLEAYRLNLMRPMPHNGQPRRKILEGDIRCKDDKGKWSDAKCLLFTDLVLLAKSSKRNSLRLLRPPIRLDRVVLHKLGDQNYSFLLVALTDFYSVDCLLCLAGENQKASDDWIDRIAQARAALLAQLQQPQQHSSPESQPQQQPPPMLQPQISVELVRLRSQHQQQRSTSTTIAINSTTYSSGGVSGQLHYTRSSGDMDSLLTTTTSTATQQQRQTGGTPYHHYQQRHTTQISYSEAANPSSTSGTAQRSSLNSVGTTEMVTTTATNTSSTLTVNNNSAANAVELQTIVTDEDEGSRRSSNV